MLGGLQFVCNPLQEPEQLRLKKRINSALAGIELLSYSYLSRCVCVCLRVHPCLRIPVMKPLRWVVQNLQNHTGRPVPLSLFNKISWPEKCESSTYVAESLPACWRAFPLFYFIFVNLSRDCSVLVIQVTWTQKVCFSQQRFIWAILLGRYQNDYDTSNPNGFFHGYRTGPWCHHVMMPGYVSISTFTCTA